MNISKELNRISSYIQKVSRNKQAGVWALPDTVSKAKKLEKLLSDLSRGRYDDLDTILAKLYPLYGSDPLFDEITDAVGDHLQEHRTPKELSGAVLVIIVQFIKSGILDEDPSLFRKPFEGKALDILYFSY